MAKDAEAGRAAWIALDKEVPGARMAYMDNKVRKKKKKRRRKSTVTVLVPVPYTHRHQRNTAVIYRTQIPYYP